MSASEYDADFVSAGAELAVSSPLHLIVDQPPATPLRYHGRRRHIKRLLDVAIALASMPVALPLMAAVALLVRFGSDGPALYRQDRVGQGGESFRIYKFRTMYVDSDERLRADGDLYAEYVANDFKLRNDVDPRVTRLGRFLRNTSLDELPQLFNVLGGSMSLVGPRPIVRDELARYGDAVPSYLQLRPGLTGRWQVEGRNVVRYPERANLDHDYLMNWRLRADLAIMVKTVPSVLRRRGCQ